MAKYHEDKTVFEFDPVKDLKGQEQAQQVIWSTKSLNAAVDAIKKGLPLKVNPFIGTNTKLLKPELVFQRTEEEIDDYVHCMQDVVYFASKCYIMQPDGLQPCILRDYQIEYLKHLQENRFSILLAARQIGKCLNMLSYIKLKIVKNSNIINKNDIRLEKLIYYKLDNDTYLVPLFELYNLYDNSFIWKIKYHLYKFIYRLENGGEKRNEN